MLKKTMWFFIFSFYIFLVLVSALFSTIFVEGFADLLTEKINLYWWLLIFENKFLTSDQHFIHLNQLRIFAALATLFFIWIFSIWSIYKKRNVGVLLLSYTLFLLIILCSNLAMAYIPLTEEYSKDMIEKSITNLAMVIMRVLTIFNWIFLSISTLNYYRKRNN